MLLHIHFLINTMKQTVVNMKDQLTYNILVQESLQNKRRTIHYDQLTQFPQCTSQTKFFYPIMQQ